MSHEHKVTETRLRSFCKSFLGYILEVVVDTCVIGFGLTLLGLPSEQAWLGGGVLAMATEVLCFFTHYFNERLWNKIQWGRKVEDIICQRKKTGKDRHTAKAPANV